MRTVKVKVSELLKHLQTNRDNHIHSYKEMMDTYRLAVVAKLEEKLEAAKRNEDVDHTIDLQRPVSFLESYDTAIAKLQWTTETEVELDDVEFNSYILDKWHWKNVFTGSETYYNEVKTNFSKR